MNNRQPTPPDWCSLTFVRAHCEWIRNALPAELTESAWILLVLYAELERVEGLNAALRDKE